MSAPDPIKEAWQASVTETSLPPIDTIRGWADTFYRKIKRRNLIEYAACAIVVPGFTGYALFLHDAAVRIGAALVVLGTIFVFWQLHRRASAVPPPEAAGALSILAYQREQLVRQRDAMADIFLWYLLPLIPGLALMTLAPQIQPGTGARPHTHHAGLWIALATDFIVFGGIWWLNRRAARKLQKYIDGIDALTGRME